MAPFIIGIKDHMGHFIMKDEDIDKIFDITQKANLIYMSHTQDPEHSWRMYELSKGRSYIWDMPMQQEQAVTEMQKKQCSR